MHLSVPCPLSTRLVTCLVMWCYMGRKLLKFCVIGIRKRKKVHCYWYVYSNLVVIIKCFFINGENRLNRVILNQINQVIIPIFSTCTRNRERYSEGLWLIDRPLL